MSEGVAEHEKTRPKSISELPILAKCEDCSLVSIWEPDGEEEHPHSEATGHEINVAGLGDLPRSEQFEVYAETLASGEIDLDSERILDEDERSRALAQLPYGETELEAKIRGPKVSADEYYERLKVTKLNAESGGLHGWTKLSLPTDLERIDQFIETLQEAREELADLQADDGLRTDGGHEQTGPEQCGGCGAEESIGDLYPLIIDLPDLRDECLGEFCSDCAGRLADSDFSLEVGTE